VFASTERGFDRPLGDAIVAADQLHKHIGGGIDSQVLGIVKPPGIGHRHGALLRARTRRNRHHLDVASDVLGEPAAVLRQQLQQPRPNGAQSGNAKSQRLVHGCTIRDGGGEFAGVKGQRNPRSGVGAGRCAR